MFEVGGSITSVLVSGAIFFFFSLNVGFANTPEKLTACFCKEIKFGNFYWYAK